MYYVSMTQTPKISYQNKMRKKRNEKTRAGHLKDICTLHSRQEKITLIVVENISSNVKRLNTQERHTKIVTIRVYTCTICTIHVYII